MGWEDTLKGNCGCGKDPCESLGKAVKKDKQIEKEILAMFKKEGGALGMKNLKSIAPKKHLDRILNAMKRRKVIREHKHGDLIME